MAARKPIVYRMLRDTGCYDWSPFVNKLETRMRFGRLEYTATQGDRGKAPKGKLPYVGFENSSELRADSSLIIRDFIQESRLSDLNAKLDASDKMMDAGITALLEERINSYQGVERWQENFPIMSAKALESVPWPLSMFIGWWIYRTKSSLFYGQGIGRFTYEEVSNMRFEAWSTIDNFLQGTKVGSAARGEARKGPFWLLGGNAPTEADATVYGFIVSSLVCDGAPDTKKDLRRLPTLMEYVDRIHDEYFPDYQKWES